MHNAIDINGTKCCRGVLKEGLRCFVFSLLRSGIIPIDTAANPNKAPILTNSVNLSIGRSPATNPANNPKITVLDVGTLFLFNLLLKN